MGKRAAERRAAANLWLAVWLSVVAVLAWGLVSFSNPFAPIGLWARLGHAELPSGFPWWAFWAAALAWAASLVLALREARWAATAPLVLFAGLVGASPFAMDAMEAERERIVVTFAAECVALEPLRRSFREAPRDLQLFLHGAAVKDGAPYAWSWREMAFYPLDDRTWPNVLPRDVASCVSDDRRRAARSIRA